ncbi:hypothetical protein BJ742DRAFT_211283 [Cladochytrium replicatum]|nr:hypothetical protein BJ742DRAFT_211283 [Cladochytrium replicatum]
MNFGPEWMRKASIHGNVGPAMPSPQQPPAANSGLGRGGAAPFTTSLAGWNTAVGGGQNASKASSSPVGTRRPMSATELMLTPGQPIPGTRAAASTQGGVSNGLSTSFPSNSGTMGSHNIPPAATSEYRYSRDIMLSLFDPDYPTPENMGFHDFVMSRSAREPMANTPLTHNERKLLASNNVNSDPRGSGSNNPQSSNAGQAGASSAQGRYSRDRGQSGDGVSNTAPSLGGIGRGIGRGTPIRRYDRTTEGDRQIRECKE